MIFIYLFFFIFLKKLILLVWLLSFNGTSWNLKWRKCFCEWHGNIFFLPNNLWIIVCLYISKNTIYFHTSIFTMNGYTIETSCSPKYIAVVKQKACNIQIPVGWLCSPHLPTSNWLQSRAQPSINLDFTSFTVCLLAQVHKALETLLHIRQ